MVGSATQRGTRLTSARSIKIWSIVHRWTSLICTLFILLLCITGLPLIFKDEIDAWVYDEAEAPAVADAAALPLDRLVETAQRRFPGEFIQVFFWSPNQLHVVIFVMGPAARAATSVGLHGLAIDARTAEIVSEPKPRRGVTFYLLKLHTDLFLGLPATLFLGAMGLVLILALVSGAVIYAPFARKLGFGEVRREHRRTRWLDLHNLLGIVILTWVAVVGATGVLNTLAAPLFDLWRAQELPRLIHAYQGKPLPAQLSSVDDVVAIARRASPDMKLVSVVFPHSRFSSPRHYLVWTKGTTPLTAHLFAPVLIDAETGAFTGVLNLPWYLRALELSRPLHFGNYGGLPLKVIWALLDIGTIVVLGSGLYLWLRRRPVLRDNSALPAPELIGTRRASAPRRARSPASSTWAVPSLLAALTMIGLLSGLLGDGVWDLVSWMTLGIIAVATAWYLRQAPSPGSSRAP